MFNLNIYLHLDFLDFILPSCAVQWHKSCFGSLTSKISNHLQSCIQGFNARKVISEVYASFVLQCTVFGRKSKHKTDVTVWHGILFQKIIHEIFWSYETIMLIIKIKWFYPPRILDKHWCKVLMQGKLIAVVYTLRTY